MRAANVCRCGNPARWAEDPAFPVEYDPQTSEFNVVHGRSGKARWRMFFCPSCGGRLPESQRQSLFTIPSDEERQEVVPLLEGIHDAASMQRVLGEPDEVAEWLETEETGWERYGVRRWKRQFSYQKRWKTLILMAVEEEDNSITFSISGRHR